MQQISFRVSVTYLAVTAENLRDVYHLRLPFAASFDRE